jgi:uncharacterized protein
VAAPSTAWLEELRARIGEPAAPPRTAPDPVNLPAIRRWCEAMGERNPLYLDEAFAARAGEGGVVAPPAMLEVWTMERFQAEGPRERPTLLGIEALDAVGFTSVVATNLEQEYLRYLRPGDLLTQHVRLADVSDEKRTALGTGHFLSYHYEFTDQHGAVVGRMRFRILKFRPPAMQATAPAVTPPTPSRPRPSVTRDNAFFWEGLRERRLLARKCARCGHLHHPPGPMCPRCHALEWSAVTLSGRGSVHSYVVVHEPRLPGFSYPLPVALIELEEGVRLVGNLPRVSAEAMRIGMAVEVFFEEVEPGYVLYAFCERHRS